jgi:hypothetical protein
MILKLIKLADPAYKAVWGILMGQEGHTWNDAVALLFEKEIALLLAAPQLEQGLTVPENNQARSWEQCYNYSDIGQKLDNCWKHACS